jgi:cytochrome c2
MRLAILVLAAAVLPRAAAAGDDPVLVARGARLVREAECGRCHAVAALDLEAAPRERSCSGCHAWIRGTRDDDEARAREARVYPLWNQYVAHVKSYLAVPDLAAAGARLDPAWVSRFLRAPYKVRPGFDETMIRTPFDADAADAVAAFLRAKASRPLAGVAAAAAALPASSRPEDVAEGQRLYDKLMCARCHAFGARAAQPGLPAAPDLAHARARMRPGDVAAFIADPAAFGAEQRMPGYGLGAREAARLRDYLLGAPLAPAAAPAAAATAEAPLLARRVTWQEVNTRVFSAVCAHCHSDGRLTDGDGGPGNTGGLGYAGAGLDLGSYRGLLRGARRPDGRRVSLLVAGPGEDQPPLLARLYRRAAEHAGELEGHAPSTDTAPGMPLGQPPLDGERLLLVRSWLAQGAPGPGGRHGIPR